MPHEVDVTPTIPQDEKPSHSNSDNNSIFKKSNKETVEQNDDKKEKLLDLENNTIGNEPEIQTRTLFHRLFSKLERGSIRGSVFAMSSLAIGAGSLALPYRFPQLSILGAVIMILIGAAVTYWSLSIMIVASKSSGKGIDNYSALVKEVLGNRMGLFLDITIVIYLFGLIIEFQVMVVYDLHENVNYPQFEDFQNENWERYSFKFPIMYGVAILLIPFCLLKDLSRMRYVSLFSILSLIYAILVVVVQCPSYYNNYKKNIYNENDPKTHVNWYDLSKGFDSHLYFFQGFATIFFSFNCHTGAFPIYTTLKNRVTKRVNKVFRNSVLLSCIVYLLIGVCGYLTQPVNTPELVIFRTNLLGNDTAMIIGRAVTIFGIFFHVPPNWNALRLSLLQLIWGDAKISIKRNILLTLSLLFATCLIAILYDKITDYISILGGFCAVIFMFLIPSLLYIKTGAESWNSKKNIVILIIISLLCVIGFIAGVMTIVDIFR